ncbi:methyltransferase RsmF C-terminal domain-like protein [Gynurincola endophyticus]|uniref:methyltransferase RsmF C-terminal domain-like protein n=1 Tax=Gynurincola endophyticus TaxID=2479004 RepID=UPI000F8C3B4A|nr:RNA methyltransferase [Gynurincola endophyticus]
MAILPSALIDALSQIEHLNVNRLQEVHHHPETITSIRLNPLKQLDVPVFEVNGESVITSDVPWNRYGRYLSQRPSFIADPLLHAGAYYVQEASSMFVEQALKAAGADRTGLKVLDLCAAPGGKSTLIQSYIDPGSLLVSNEVIKNRANILEENLTKWGGANVMVSNNDPADFSPLKNFFDVIVVDAPCSGSGLFRRDAEAIDEWSLQNVQLCCQRQQRILADILPVLKEDGYLIYSTCSFSVEENEKMVDWLLATFELASVPVPLEAEWKIQETISEKEKGKGYRFYPHLLKGEGFFLAVFQKKSAIDKFKWKGGKKKLIQVAPKASQEVLKLWTNTTDLQYYKIQDRYFALPSVLEQDLFILSETLYLRNAGVGFGKINGHELIPEHSLALSRVYADSIPCLAVDYSQAIQYLKKQALNLSTNKKGWHLVTYQSLPLGWVKILANRMNNYYPANWRILKDI